jgi:hypothetical protein
MDFIIAALPKLIISCFIINKENPAYVLISFYEFRDIPELGVFTSG